VKYEITFKNPCARTGFNECLDFYIKQLMHYFPDLDVVDRIVHSELGGIIACVVESDLDLFDEIEKLHDWAPYAINRIRVVRG